MNRDPFDQFQKIAAWARNRYTKDGVLPISNGGIPSRYTKIVDAAVDKYILNKEIKNGRKTKIHLRRRTDRAPAC
jgi:hypothetical protein